MSMHRYSNLHDPAPGWYAKWLRAIRQADPRALVRDPFTGWTVPAADIVAEAQRALHRRINARGGDFLANVPLSGELLRDCRAVEDRLHRRVRVYQLETKLMRRRYSHILCDRNEI